MKAERVADGNRHLPDAHSAGVAKTSPGQRAGVDAEHSQVGMRIVADEIAASRAPVRQGHRELWGPVNDVTVRQYEAVRREDNARTASPLSLDTDDRRADCLDGADNGRRVRVEQFVIIGLAKWTGSHRPIVGIGHAPDITRTGGGSEPSHDFTCEKREGV